MKCPICGTENDYNWPLQVDGQIKTGGCQECWEKQCDEEWWKMVKTIYQIKKSSRRSEGMNYIITEEELTSLEKTGNPSYRKSVEYVVGRIRSRPVEPDLEDAITKQIDYANGMPRKAELMKLSKGEIVERLLFAYNTISKLEKAVSHEKELFTREQVSKIVDYCFHKHASFYRGKDAEVAIEEAIKSSSKA